MATVVVAVATGAFTVGRISTIRDEVRALRDEYEREIGRARNRLDALERDIREWMARKLQ